MYITLKMAGCFELLKWAAVFLLGVGEGGNLGKYGTVGTLGTLGTLDG